MTAILCTNPCGCPDTAYWRVWFTGCAAGCGGHMLCKTHGNGRMHGIVRAEHADPE